jgi:hypothetical protein
VITGLEGLIVWEVAVIETLAVAGAEDAAELCQWGDPAPPNVEEEELDLIAFKLWQSVSCLEAEAEDTVSDETEAALCHAAAA